MEAQYLAADWAAFCPSEQPAGPALFAPVHYEPGYRYPLVAWLHGPGADPNELQRVMPLLSLRNYVAVAPQGPRPVGLGFTWPDRDRGLSRASDRLAEALDMAEKMFNVHPSRIFLAGIGAGGTVALRLALAEPGRYAGAVSIDGPMPRGGNPLASWPQAQRVPLWIARRWGSTRYPMEQYREDLRLASVAGLNLTTAHYSVEDDLAQPVLADVNRWVMGLVTAPRLR
jgi:phospholipase/carboxylesterase